MNIGVDLGGSHVSAGLVNEGRILAEKTVLIKKEANQKEIVDCIITAINSVKRKEVLGIGIGSPGPLDIKKGIIPHTSNLKIKNLNLKSELQKEFKLPIAVDNDANCFVLGEAVYGAGKQSSVVVGLTLGSGVGGGIVIDKKIFHGRNNAGELGHISIDYRGIECKCGNFGCLEEYASARGILRRAHGLNVSSSEDVYKLAVRGNKTAKKAFEETGFYLGIGVLNIIRAIDPDIIIIGGKVSNSWEFFNKSMIKTVRERASFKLPKIVKSSLVTKANILGAAYLAGL